VLGVHAHGVAADLWAAERGPAGLLARELADRLPDALMRLRKA
jgi:NAD(P)H-hydrate repair Nnr-like enzyme with NAD(P)H-hydrate dehydratase domain